MGEPVAILDPPDTPVAQPIINDRQTKMVLEVSRLLAIPTELDHLLSRIAEICCNLLDCEAASIFLHDQPRDELWSKVVMQSEEIRASCTVGIVGHAFTTNAIAHSDDPYNDPRFNPIPDQKSGFHTRNLLACSMPDIDGKPLGVIEAVNKRRGSFCGNDGVLIHLLADQAAVAIQRHHLQSQACQNVVLRYELNLARQVQEAMLPKSPPQVAGLDAIGWAQPASTTGGDCFDLWKTSDGRLGILLADASGHGLAPAMIVSQVRTMVRAISDIETDPHCLLSHANTRLFQDLRNGQFVTAFIAFVSSDGTIHWSSAGHGPVLLRTSAADPITHLLPPSMPLGVTATFAGDAPPAAKMEPGGSLSLMSDGIFESCGPDGKIFSADRVVAILDQHRNGNSSDIVQALRQAVQVWRRGQDPQDDQTIVIVRRAR